MATKYKNPDALKKHECDEIINDFVEKFYPTVARYHVAEFISRSTIKRIIKVKRYVL